MENHGDCNAVHRRVRCGLKLFHAALAAEQRTQRSQRISAAAQKDAGSVSNETGL